MGWADGGRERSGRGAGDRHSFGQGERTRPRSIRSFARGGGARAREKTHRELLGAASSHRASRVGGIVVAVVESSRDRRLSRVRARGTNGWGLHGRGSRTRRASCNRKMLQQNVNQNRDALGLRAHSSIAASAHADSRREHGVVVAPYRCARARRIHARGVASSAGTRDAPPRRANDDRGDDLLSARFRRVRPRPPRVPLRPRRRRRCGDVIASTARARGDIDAERVRRPGGHPRRFQRVGVHERCHRMRVRHRVAVRVVRALGPELRADGRRGRVVQEPRGRGVHARGVRVRRAGRAAKRRGSREPGRAREKPRGLGAAATEHRQAEAEDAARERGGATR